MSGLVVKNNSELWFNNNKISTSIGTNGLYMDSNRNLFFNNTKIASGNLNNPLGLHLINNELAYDGIKFETMQSLISSLFINSEQGFVYDINDLSTLYQDAQGLVAVTNIGQPVGKVMDKSGRGNHATQSTSSKRPLLQQNTTTGAYYLQFDGVDDFLETNNIDLSSISQLSLFASVRKLSDTTQVIAEFSTSGYSQAGGFYLITGSDGGSNGYSAAATNGLTKVSPFLAPDNAVLSSTFNRESQVLVLRRNGVAGTSGRTSSGNFSSYPLYIGARAGAVYRFSGHLYSLIGVARLANDNEIANAERVIAKNVGVTL